MVQATTQYDVTAYLFWLQELMGIKGFSEKEIKAIMARIVKAHFLMKQLP